MKMSEEDRIVVGRIGGLPGFARKIKEAITGVPAVIVRAWSKDQYEIPEVTFTLQMQVYRGDYMARTAVDFMADAVAGPGFYITVDETYEFAEDVVKFITEWCRRNKIDQLLQLTFREAIGFGNSFWQKVEPKGEDDAPFDVKLIPLESLDGGIKRDPVTGLVAKYKQTQGFGGKELEPETVIHWRWNPIGNQAEGVGIISALCYSLSIKGGRKREPLYQAVAGLQQDIIEQMETWSAPNQLYVFPEMDDDAVDAWAAQLKAGPRRGARWATNVKDANIVQAESRRPGGWDEGVRTLLDMYIVALHTPLPKLISKEGFTEASARAAVEVAERMTMSHQRWGKRMMEDVFNELIEGKGWDPIGADIDFEWGPPESVDPETVQALFPSLVVVWEKGGIRTSEMRTILREVLHLDMIEEAKIEELELEAPEERRASEPKTDEERAKEHFGISDEEWEEMSEEDRAAKIAELPERGPASEEEKVKEAVSKILKSLRVRVTYH